MFQFFVSPAQINPEIGQAVITGPDVNHICHVLRMHPGEQFYVNDGSASGKYLCSFSRPTKTVLCAVFWKRSVKAVNCLVRLHFIKGCQKRIRWNGSFKKP